MLTYCGHEPVQNSIVLKRQQKARSRVFCVYPHFGDKRVHNLRATFLTYLS